MNRILAAMALAGGLSACAQAPEAIMPVAMPAGAYDRLPCATARAERARIAQGLAPLEAGQRTAATNDAIGVFLIGVPVASLGGADRAAAIATERGKLVALDARLARC